MTARTMSEVIRKKLSIQYRTIDSKGFIRYIVFTDECDVPQFLSECRALIPEAVEIVAVEEVWNVVNRG